jgi:hypothetical protein
VGFYCLFYFFLGYLETTETAEHLAKVRIRNVVIIVNVERLGGAVGGI